MIVELRRLRGALQTADAEIRAACPKCPKCHLPTGGIVQSGQTRREGKICDCKKEG